uniref:Uncharacterized protein n=1 Tax=uncultured marine group II/III euryarchaeote KM3_174_A11 TaxID=1457931 RepID=A0A075GQJ3_9EURY|nr:hypothetical protein [uncultured marine group II/III euryarchaeote KM3_174_A11]
MSDIPLVRRQSSFVLLLISLLLASSLSSLMPHELVSQVSAVSGRSCGGPDNVTSIEILPPGPVSVKADGSQLFEITLKDSAGLVVDGSADWGTDNGTLVPQSSTSILYYPWAIGAHEVWACVGDVNKSVIVDVVIGVPVDLQLTADDHNITADETLDLDVLQFDSRGNSGPVTTFSSDWVVPEGSAIELIPGESPRWIPGPIGRFNISVSVDEYIDTWEVNVSRGAAQNLFIEHDSVSITSDEALDLTMVVADQRDNRWVVNGTWSMIENESSSWLTQDGATATFEGNSIGSYTVRAIYSGPDNGNVMMMDELTIQVTAGDIAQISLSGHDSDLLTGESVELLPIAKDLDGNIITDATFNWSVDGPSGNAAIDALNATFTALVRGQHNIYAEADGIPAQIRVQVDWSPPVDLNLTDANGDWYLTVVTGESLHLHVSGLDVMGSWHDYNPTWQVDGSHGTIEEAGGDGDFIFHAGGVGWIQLRAFVGQTEHTFLVNLLPGQLDHLVITAPEDGTQGETVQFTVGGFDVSGHPVAIPTCDVDIASSAGEATCEDDVWTLNLDNHGEQQSIRATYDGAESNPSFIDVQSTLLAGQLGTSEDVIALGSVFVGLLIAMLLVLAYRRAGRVAYGMEYEDDDEEDEHEPMPVSAPVPGLTGMPQPATAVVPMPPGIVLPPGQIPPPAAVGVPPPPSPDVARAIQRGKMGQRGKQSAPKPAAPPPAFLFGQGLAANSTTAALPQPQPGVFVQSKPEYGWGDSPSHPGPLSDGYGWVEGADSQATPPAEVAPATEAEEGGDLSNALAAFGTTDTEEEAEVVEDSEEVIVEADADEAEPEGEEIAGDDDSENDVDDDADVLTESGEREGEQADVDAEPESDEDSVVEDESELGDSEDWGSDWGDELDDPWAESDMAEDGSESEEDELEGESSEPGLGPMTEDGELLKPLPGTSAGETGWYLFSDGKPSLWEFRAVGWERVE